MSGKNVAASSEKLRNSPDVDKDTVLSQELVVTKLEFALLSKLPDQAQYNVCKHYYMNFLGPGKMKDYFKIREVCGKSKWKFKMAFAMKGGGSRGGLECHIPIFFMKYYII